MSIRRANDDGQWALRYQLFAIVVGMIAVSPSAAAEPLRLVRFPVPVRAWFEPQYLDTRPKLYVAMNMITSHTDDQQSRQVTRATLAKLMIIVKAEYPEMAGVAFYGYKDDSSETPELIAEAEKLALEL